MAPVTLTREEMDRLDVLANLTRHPSPTIPSFDLESHLEEHAVVHNSLYFADCSDPNEIFDLRLLYQTRVRTLVPHSHTYHPIYCFKDLSYHISIPKE